MCDQQVLWRFAETTNPRQTARRYAKVLAREIPYRRCSDAAGAVSANLHDTCWSFYSGEKTVSATFRKASTRVAQKNTTKSWLEKFPTSGRPY